MRTWILIAAATLALACTGCNRIERHDDSALQARIDQLSDQLAAATRQRDSQDKTIADLTDQMGRLRAENVRLGKAIDDKPAAAAGVSIEDVRKEIAEALRKNAVSGTTDQPVTDRPKVDAPKVEPTPEEVTKEIERLKPLVLANPEDRDNVRSLRELLWKSDKKTRADIIDALKKIVAERPDDKFAQLALAEVQVTRFPDLVNPMDQGMLAMDIMKHIKAAKEIDPDYYDTQEFLGIYQSNYPKGFPEFEAAGGELDKALAMQAKLPWNERFSDVYTAYAKWYQKQGKTAEALAKVQEGLRQAPTNTELLDLKKTLEDK